MNNVLKRVSPAMFVIVLICFFLPFTTFTCSGEKMATITGVQYLTGTSITVPGSGSFGSRPQTEEISPEPLIIVVLVFTVLGLIISFANGTISYVLSVIAGIGGTIFLFLFKSKVDKETLAEGGGMIHVDFNLGFWLAVVFLVLIVLFNFFLSVSKDSQKGNFEP